MSKKSNKPQSTMSKDFESLFAELKVEYIDSFQEKVDAIYDSWQKRSLGPLTMEFHKIKGTGTTYGIPQISDIAEIMEDLCHQKSEKLGLCVLFSIHLFKKVCQSEKGDLSFQLEKDPLYKFLQDSQDELESA